MVKDMVLLLLRKIVEGSHEWHLSHCFPLSNWFTPEIFNVHNYPIIFSSLEKNNQNLLPKLHLTSYLWDIKAKFRSVKWQNYSYWSSIFRFETNRDFFKYYFIVSKREEWQKKLYFLKYCIKEQFGHVFLIKIKVWYFKETLFTWF